MNDLIDFYWHGALWHWFHSGSTDGIVYALERNVPMKPEEARFLAAIVAGKVQPRGNDGGASYIRREVTHFRNSNLVVPLYQRALRVAKWHAKRHPEKRLDPRAEAYEWVSNWFPRGVGVNSSGKRPMNVIKRPGVSSVKRIITEPAKWKKSVISDKAESEFRTLWATFEKKPNEVF